MENYKDRELVERINWKIQNEENLTMKEKIRAVGGFFIYFFVPLIGAARLQKIIAFKEKVE